MDFSPSNALLLWVQAIAPYGIFTTDRALRIRTWNDWLAAKGSLPASSVLGRPLGEVFPELAPRKLYWHFSRALAGEIIVLSTALHKYLLPFAGPPGNGMPPQMLQTVRIAPLWEGNVITGTITVIEDVTQREVHAGLLRRTQELERLLSAALAILLQSRDPSAEIGAIFASLAPILRMDSYLGYLRDPNGEGFHLQLSGGLLPLQRTALAAIQLDEAALRELEELSPGLTPQAGGQAGVLHRLGFRTIASFPLAVGSRLFGMLVFASFNREEFTSLDNSVLSRVARYFALAIERSQRERDTVAASRAKDDFLAALSHELRTPLNPVLLLASESEGNPEFPEEAREIFRVIGKNVLLEARLIDDLLDITRIENGKLALEMAPVDLHGIIRDAVETVRPDLSRNTHVLEVDLAASRHLVSGDAGRLQQVFWNVLKNAVKFTPHSGKIRIASETPADGSEVVVSITDTGIGMNQKELDRIFTAFAQGEHAQAGGPHRFGGLGLGLAISRRLVESHGGRIAASSPGKGQGSTFRIHLPVSTPFASAAALATPEPAVDSTEPFPPGAEPTARKILLVEDHEPSRATVSYLLKRRGYDVVAVGNSAGALEAASGGTRFSLVISDIGLPDMDGVSLMHTLRSRYGLRGVALTGYGTEDDLARTTKAGFLAHLTKPISAEALDRVLVKVFPPKSP